MFITPLIYQVLIKYVIPKWLDVLYLIISTVWFALPLHYDHFNHLSGRRRGKMFFYIHPEISYTHYQTLKEWLNHWLLWLRTLYHKFIMEKICFSAKVILHMKVIIQNKHSTSRTTPNLTDCKRYSGTPIWYLSPSWLLGVSDEEVYSHYLYNVLDTYLINIWRMKRKCLWLSPICNKPIKSLEPAWNKMIGWPESFTSLSEYIAEAIRNKVTKEWQKKGSKISQR